MDMFDVYAESLDERISVLRKIINKTVNDIDENIILNIKNSVQSPSS
jgi:hypothetical protein